MNTLPFTIRDVARITSIKVLKDKGSSLLAVCPYCGDTRGKFDLCIHKNGYRKDTFHCYNCDEGGNMLKLYADMTGADFNSEEGRKKIVKDIIAALGTNYVSDLSIPEPVPARPDNELDIVYRALLAELSLYTRHIKDLNRRGIEDVSMFKSVPDNPAKVCKILRDKGFELSRVPGFYLRKGYWTFSSIPGYFCPAFNLKGEIIGFQIRTDNPKDGRKYIWLSSSGKEGGTSMKARPTFLGDVNSSSVVVTEGVLKAYVYHVLTGNTVIGLPGINNRKGLKEYLNNMPNLLKVCEAYDMDKLRFPECRHDYKCDKCQGTYYGLCRNKINQVETIKKEQQALISEIKAMGYDVKSWYWDHGQYRGEDSWLEHHKGIDDYILAKKKEKEENI